MKKLLLAALLAGSVYALSAQARFQLGAAYFPNLSWEQDPLIESYEARLSTTAGLTVSYSLSPNWRLETGLAYANFGDRLKTEAGDLNWGTQHNGNGGFDPDLPNLEEIDALKLVQVNHCLEVPLRLTYHGSGDGLRFYASAGIAPRFHLGASAKSEFRRQDGSTETKVEQNETTDFDRLQWSWFTACGAEISLSDKIMVYAGPRAQWHRLTGEQPSTLSQAPFSTTYLQLGLELGLRLQ